MGKSVKVQSMNAAGTLIAHTKPESKIIVTMASPPERSVKYEEFANASRGTAIAHIIIILVANVLVVSSIL